MLPCPVNGSFGQHGSLLQKYGQTQYQQRNYKGALDAFTQALEFEQNDVVGILDNRAATYCKLQLFSRAVQDGRQMIKVDKLDARGYLRIAKILQLMERFDSALQTYQYALQVLPVQDPKRQQIQLLMGNLEKRTTPPTLADPFTIFPLEIVSMILEFLSLKNLFVAMRVSKNWKRLTTSVPKLWAHLDLSMARKAVSLRSVRAYIRRTQSAITRVTVDNVNPTATSDMMKLITQCPSLSYLDVRLKTNINTCFEPIHSLPNLATLVMSNKCLMTNGDLGEIFRKFPRLECVEVHFSCHFNIAASWPASLPNLRRLAICSNAPLILHGPLSTSELRDGSLSEKIPNLEELCLSDTFGECPYPLPKLSSLTHLRQLELFHMKLVDWPELPQSLEYISLSQCALESRHIFGNILEGKNLPNLKTAIFSGSKIPSYEFLAHFLTNSKASLTHLDLESCPNIFQEELQRLMLEGHLSMLTDLNIAGLAGINDNITPIIIDTMPNLKVLDLSNSHVTGISLKDLADAERVKIDKLSAKNCSSPLSLDAVEYALRRGIRLPYPLDRNSSLGLDLWPGLRRTAHLGSVVTRSRTSRQRCEYV